MIINKKNSEGYDISGNSIQFVDEDKYMEMLLASSYDLHFKFYSIGESKSFEITKEDYFIYEKFSNLYEKIKNNEVYDLGALDLKDINSKEELEYQKELLKDLNERSKKKGHYDELFHDDIITVKTDNSDTNNDYFTLEKEEDKFTFTFNNNSSVIKICNGDSYYRPYNILFMECFNELMKYDKNKENRVRTK